MSFPKKQVGCFLEARGLLTLQWFFSLSIASEMDGYPSALR